ncbi:MAG: hypothetical protein U0X20_11320 [Caldilineaceae bacterium]
MAECEGERSVAPAALAQRAMAVGRMSTAPFHMRLFITFVARLEQLACEGCNQCEVGARGGGIVRDGSGAGWIGKNGIHTHGSLCACD